jgi:hypothetical protein
MSNVVLGHECYYYIFSKSTKLLRYFRKVQVLIYIVGKIILINFKAKKHVKSLSRKTLQKTPKILKTMFLEKELFGEQYLGSS